MAETQKPKVVWYSPQALADRANDGFLFAVRFTEKGICSIPSSTAKGFLSIARFAGRATHFIQSGTVNGILKVGQVLFRKKIKQETEPMKEESLPQNASLEANADTQQGDTPSPTNGEAAEPVESELDPVTEEEPPPDEVSQEVAKEIPQEEEAPEEAVASEPQMTASPQDEKQTEPVEEEFLPQNASLETNADTQQGDAPSPANSKAVKPVESTPAPVVEEKPPPDEEEVEQEGPQYPPLGLEALLKQYSPRDRVEAIRLRQALDDLLHGSEAARLVALKTMVGLRQVAEPFLVASLQTASPQVAEIGLEGLSQIGSQRLIGCISDVLASSDPELRIVALRAAQRLRDDEARPFLERGLQDPSTRVKRRVISYLSWHDSSWALAEIWRLCDDPEPDVKWAALEALLTMRPSKAYDNLELMMSSLEPAYRRRVVTLLKQRKSLLNKDGDAPFPANGEAAEPAESTPASVAEEKPPREEVSLEVAEEISEKEDTPEEAEASELQMMVPSHDEEQTEPVEEESLAQDASPKAAADAPQGDAPSPANSKAAEPVESSVTEEEEDDHSVMMRWGKRSRNILHWR